MEEINLKELFDYVKERILIILIIILSVLVIGSVYSLFIKTPLYRSTSTVVLVSDNSSTTTSDVQLNNQLVATYSKIVTSPVVMEKVIQNLGLDYNTNDLSSKISVSTETGTQIIKVSVSDPDKSLATDITNEVVKVFSAEIKNIYNLSNVSIIGVAGEAENPYNSNYLKDFVIYFLVGTVLALGTIFVVFYFDTSIKSAEEVENKLGLPVIGIIPKVKRDHK